MERKKKKKTNKPWWLEFIIPTLKKWIQEDPWGLRSVNLDQLAIHSETLSQ